MLSAELGQELERLGSRWRVVRIVKQDCLFEDEEGKLEVVTEHMLELKNQEGHIDFEVLTSERTPYSGVTSTIKAPEPIVWRKE